MTSAEITVFPVSRQVSFHQMLGEAREKWLIDAVRGTAARVDPIELKRQLAEFAPADAQQILASNGIRDEEVFPTPILLEAQPTLVGYYRLLLGVGQKTFYRGGTGMGPLKSMETTGILRVNQRTLIPQFCTAMGQALATLIRQLSPMVTARDVHELPLLTLGGQFQGASNVSVGQQASTDVFLAIDEIVKTHVEDRTARSIRINNSAGRPVWIILGSDPNVSIREDFGGGLRNKVAIQIKRWNRCRERSQSSWRSREITP